VVGAEPGRAYSVSASETPGEGVLREAVQAGERVGHARQLIKVCKHGHRGKPAASWLGRPNRRRRIINDGADHDRGT
jgi:hypothetical protein